MMARIRKWSWKNWPPMKALNPYHDVFMISCSNNKVISCQAPAWDGNWRRNDVKWLQSSSCASDLTVTQITQHLSDQMQRIARCPGKLCPKASVAPTQTLTVAPPCPQSHSDQAKCFATSDCWLSELLCVDWSSVSSKRPKTQNVSPL